MVMISGVRAIASILTRRHIAKGLRFVARCEPGVAFRAARNLLLDRLLEGRGVIYPGGTTELFDTSPVEPHLPLVSVVIPCVNHGTFVGDAVASVLAQTFPSIEIIVVDGGSDDGTTPAAVAGLAGPRVRVLLRDGPPKMLGDNRNFGIAEARGRYICCLDADDMLAPTYIEKTLFVMEQGGFDVVGTSLVEFGTRHGEWRVPAIPTLDGFSVSNQTICCALFRKDAWARVGGYSDVTLRHDGIPEDWEFWLRLAAKGARFRNITGESLMRYRVRGPGTSLSSAACLPSFEEQRRNLTSRHRALLTSEAIERSRREAARRLRPADPNTPMVHALGRDAESRRAAMSKDACTLMITLPYFHLGGAERVLSQVAAALARQGWRVIVVATGTEDPACGDSLPWFEAATQECYALGCFLPREQMQSFMLHLLRTRRPDVLLNAGSQTFYELLPEIAAEYPCMARLDLLFNVVGHIDSHLAHRSLLTGALCENREVLDWLIGTARWAPDQVAIVPSGVDTARFTPGARPADFVERLGVSPSDIVIGWAGRMAEEKAPQVFVELAQRCRDMSGVRFVMAGSGPLSGYITKKARGKAAAVLGQVDDDDVPQFYRLCDIFVLTSSVDGRPNALMEAQASGCAVLASRIGGVPEIMRDGATGRLAKPADVRDFERLLRAMVADRDALAAMREAASALARAEFSADVMAEGYRAAFAKAVTAFRCNEGDRQDTNLTPFKGQI